jgi:hypothetical protein
MVEKMLKGVEFVKILDLDRSGFGFNLFDLVVKARNLGFVCFENSVHRTGDSYFFLLKYLDLLF